MKNEGPVAQIRIVLRGQSTRVIPCAGQGDDERTVSAVNGESDIMMGRGESQEKLFYSLTVVPAEWLFVAATSGSTRARQTG